LKLIFASDKTAEKTYNAVTDEFMKELHNFSKIHQYDHRKDFKEAWNTWIEENNDIVTDEIRRLTEMGYDGDILDKMFKSARYYFRKKSTEKNEPQARNRREEPHRRGGARRHHA
jgi:hypothetical protein